MNKTLIIIQREYLTRVRKKTFIISTILFPIMYLLLIFGTGYIASSGDRKLTIAMVDQSGYFDEGRIQRENLRDSSTLLVLTKDNPDSLRTHFSERGFDAFVLIPDSLNWETGNIKSYPLYTSRTMGIQGIEPVQNKLNNIWAGIKNEKLGIDDAKKEILEKSKIRVTPININDERSNSGIATVIGYTSGFLMYIILLLYGTQVMMGVLEEKTNRIAEVIVSSVKPFQLMLGKIIGIGLVALTQFFLWVVLVFIIYNVTKTSGGVAGMGGMLDTVQQVFTSTNIPLFVFCFAFYLLGGFFFYASLYAAIGSAVNEDMREAQSLSFPITMLVIISIAIMTAAIKDPTSPIAVWGSIIPFSSPIIMLARIPFGVPGTVPWWQLGASMAALIAGFVFTTWFAGKIYRTGILMYGKKPTWKELIKWAMRKN